MLALAFFLSVFSSLFWLIYAGLFVADKLGGIPLTGLSLFDAALYTSFLLLPVFFIWAVFGYVNQYINNRAFGRNIVSLLSHMKKNLDYTDLLARVMLESEQEIKDGFILNKFDIFVADMNEILAEIIKRAGIASSEQIENLWAKVQNGGKWSFGKVLIEVSQTQGEFQLRMFNRAQGDTILSGSILEFVARYQALIALLEKHDKEHVFLNLIETGVFGKVYSIFAPVSEEIKRLKEISALKAKPSFIDNESLEKSLPKEPDTFKALDRKSSESREEVSVESVSEKEVSSSANSFGFISSIFRKKKTDVADDAEAKEEDNKQDPFTLALERSFGTEDTLTFDKEPKFDSSPVSSAPKALKDNINEPWHDDEQLDIEDFTGHPNEPKISLPEPAKTIDFEETKKTLKSLRREWEKMKKEDTSTVSQSSKSAVEESLSYPFGNWVNDVAKKN